MPIYEFQCRKCGKVIECLLSTHCSDSVLSHDCGGIMSRIISKCSFRVTAIKPVLPKPEINIKTGDDLLREEAFTGTETQGYYDI